ncbi:hypothetical protein, partial [Chitinophaga sp.]|uniref:hypothetical protein n=1 Tax=Chitinophaga sp. TaxID=1869181 RepID=UPI002F93FE66
MRFRINTPRILSKRCIKPLHAPSIASLYTYLKVSSVAAIGLICGFPGCDSEGIESFGHQPVRRLKLLAGAGCL